MDAAIHPRATFFSCTDPKTGDLAIMELPGGSTRRLTNKGASSDVTQVSVPSPDGRHVAFDWWVVEKADHSGTLKGRLKVRPQLRVTGLDGTGDFGMRARTPARCIPMTGRPMGAGARLSRAPEGACQPGRSALGRGRLQAGCRDRPRVHPECLQGALLARRALHRVRPTRRGKRRPSRHLPRHVGRGPVRRRWCNRRATILLDWSPDGRHILFSSYCTGTTDAWLLQVADGKPQGAPQLVKRDWATSSPWGSRGTGRSTTTSAWADGRCTWPRWTRHRARCWPRRLVPEGFLGRNVSPSGRPMAGRSSGCLVAGRWGPRATSREFD